jgi:peptidyl-prolyl cis-trans isomerase SurA
MKLFSALLLVLSLLATTPSAQANVVDRSVAIVNDDTITLSEVNEAGKSFFQKVAAEAPPEQLEAALQQARRAVIDKLIEKRLLTQEARKTDIKVSDEEVENALKRILESNQATIDQFRKEIAAVGMNEKQFREDLRDQISTTKLVNQAIRAKIVIPEEQALAYYQRNYTESSGEGEYHLLQIGVVWDSQDRTGNVPSQEEAKKKIENIRQLAEKGEDFRALAKQHSDLPSATDDGDLGAFKERDMAADMRSAIATLQPGDISRIVERDKSYQLFKVQSTEKGAKEASASYESAKEKIRETLFQQEMERRLKEWLDSLREKAYIKVL